MFTMGSGMMAAAGPSMMPHSFGQDLSSGIQYSQAAAMKAAQARMMGLQAQRYGMQNSAIGAVLGQPGGTTGAAPATDASNFASPQQATAAAAQRMPVSNAPTDAPLLNSSQGTPGISFSTPNAPKQTNPMANGLGAVMAQDPMFKLGFAFNPSAASTQYLNRAYPAPTDVEKLVAARQRIPDGTPQAQVLDQAIAHATGSDLNLRQGSTYHNLLTGQTLQNPHLGEGQYMLNPNDPAAGVGLAPGSAQAAGIMSGSIAGGQQAATAAYAYPIANAREAARAQNTPDTVYGPGGVGFGTSQYASIHGAPGPNGQTLPYQTALSPQQSAEGHGLGTDNAALVQKTNDDATSAQQFNLSNKQILADAQDFTTGRFSEWKGEGLSVLNGLGIKTDSKSLNSYQDMQKLLVNNALDRTRSMGSREAAQIVTLVANRAQPNVKLDPASLAQLVKFNMIPAQASQVKATALDAWRQQGNDVSHFSAQWNAANIPGQIAYHQLSPADQAAYRKANPDAVKELANAYDVAAQHGWSTLINQAAGL
jgi:hypothetical protein